MLFPLANIGDLQFRLLLIQPDFQPNQGRPLDYSLQFDTDISESRTSIEERRPGRRALLLTQTCTLLLRGTGADDWRKGLAALGPRPIGIPLWIDKLAPADWSQRIFDAQKIVGFDPDSGAFEIYDGPDLPIGPTYPFYAPLLIGRWKKRPSALSAHGTLGYVDFTIAEASPWSCRIRPHSYGAGWSAEPEPGTVKDISHFALETQTIAAAREPALEQTNAAAHWGQEGLFKFSSRQAIRQALTHFEAVRGALHAWTPLPAWFQPGADTEATPSNYTARFASDTFSLQFMSGNVARSNLGFIQEVSTPSRAQEQPGEFYLYQLRYQHDADNPELLTNCDEPITVTEGIYQPIQVAHQEIRRSLKPQDDKATVTLQYRDGSLISDWQRGRLFGWVLLTIWKCDPDNPAARGNPVYSGFVADVSPAGSMPTVEASLFGRLLKERAPLDLFGKQCNTFVFSGRCQLNEADYRSAGTTSRGDLSADGRTLTVHGAAGWGGAAYADNWFARGILRTGAGRVGTATPRIVINILKSTTVGGNLELSLSRPLWPDMLAIGGQAVDLVPGCGRQYATDCGDKFANQANFQGDPFAPDYIEQRDPGSMSKPKK